MLAQILGCTPTPIFQPRRIGDVPHSYALIEAAENLLGYRPMVGFEDGLRRTVDAMQAIAR
jgi:UDP-glucose 4-epimerase